MKKAEQTKSDIPLPIEPEVLPVDQIFRFIGVGPTKGYELIKSGALKTLKLGRKRLGRINDAREFINSLPSE